MVKINEKVLLSDKNHLNQKWDDLMVEVKEGRLDREKAVYLMERINAIDYFLIAQGIKIL